MPFIQYGEIRFFQSELFGQSVKHAFFTRTGGVSAPPWSSLNLGGTVGDDPLHVQVNRLRALDALGLDASSVYDVWQVHGTAITITDSPRKQDAPHVQADGILTDTPQITLMMRFADCVPVMLFDPVHKVIGIAHAGWMGTVLGTVKCEIQAMQTHFGSSPGDIQALIGPSIGPDHYEVGRDVLDHVNGAFGDRAKSLITMEADHSFFNLWEANRLLLEEVGVRQVEVTGICTACHVDDWYSHRAEHGRTGRFGAVIGLV